MNMKNILIALSLSGLLAVGCGDDDGGMDAGTDAGDVDSGDDMDGGDDMDSGDDMDAGDMDAGPAMPLGRDNPPALGSQFDRAGRPAISTATVGTFMARGAERDALKTTYSEDDDRSNWSTYAEGMANMMAILDGADTVCGNQFGYDDTDGVAAAYDFLAGVLADDRLLVNSGEGVCGYLGAELDTLDVTDGFPCGGRTVTEDVVDRSYTVLITGGLDDSLGDAVDADDATHSDTDFPFLAAP